MKVYFERNNSDLKWWEVDEKGFVTDCNDSKVWGVFWIGSKIPRLDEVRAGKFLIFLDPKGAMKTTHFRITKVKHATTV